MTSSAGFGPMGESASRFGSDAHGNIMDAKFLFLVDSGGSTRRGRAARRRSRLLPLCRFTGVFADTSNPWGGRYASIPAEKFSLCKGGVRVHLPCSSPGEPAAICAGPGRGPGIEGPALSHAAWPWGKGGPGVREPSSAGTGSRVRGRSAFLGQRGDSVMARNDQGGRRHE